MSLANQKHSQSPVQQHHQEQGLPDLLQQDQVVPYQRLLNSGQHQNRYQHLKVLHRLRDHGNTIVVIEHNLDVIKTADWVVDLGPEGGSGGGQIIAVGTPEEIAENPASHTGHYLAPLLDLGRESGAA